MSGIAEQPLPEVLERKLILRQLHDAAQIGDVTSVKSIFETRTQLPIDITRRGGNTTLHTALSHNQQGLLIDYLIQKGADVNRMNAKGHCPLTLAIIHCRGSSKAVKKLIFAGATWKRFHSGLFIDLSAMDVAIQYKNESAVNFLTCLMEDNNNNHPQQQVTATTNTTNKLPTTMKGQAICPICNILVKFPTKMSRLVSDQTAIEQQLQVNGEYGGGKGKHKQRKYTCRKYLDQLLLHCNGKA